MKKTLIGAGAIALLLVVIGLPFWYYFTYTGKITSSNLIFGSAARQFAENLDTYGISTVYRGQTAVVSETFSNYFPFYYSNHQLSLVVEYRSVVPLNQFAQYSVVTEAQKYAPGVKKYCEGIKSTILTNNKYKKAPDDYTVLVKTNEKFINQNQYTYFCELIAKDNPTTELWSGVMFGVVKTATGFTVTGSGF